MSCVLCERMGLPETCLLGSTIYKKQFLNTGDLTSSDKRILSQQVEKVIWQASLKPSNLNIRPYRDDVREYGEVEIIEVRLNETKNIHRIAEIIMRTIPYPVLLQLTYEDQIMLVVGHSRTSLSDSSRNAIEEFLYTDWCNMGALTNFQKQFFESIHASKLSFASFFHFYDDIVDQIILLNATRWSNYYLLEEDAKETKKITDKILHLEQQITELRKEIKNETQFNHKVEINVKLRTELKKRSILIQELKINEKSKKR